MSDFTVGPLPCRNPLSFSKYIVRKDTEKRSCEQMPVVHRNVEGENNGECFKVKNPKTPFLLKHLEKYFIEKPKEEPEKEVEEVEESQPRTSSGTKRERSNSDSGDELEDPNEPSTSSSARKKKRTDQNH